MSNEAAEARRRIRSLARLSEGAAGIAFALFALTLPLMAVVILAMPEARVELIDAIDEDALTQAPWLNATAGLLVGLAPLALSAYMLWEMRRLLGGFRRGEIFTEETARRLGGVGWIVTAMAPFSILCNMLTVLALTWSNGPGERALSLEIDDTDILAVTVGLLIVVVARVLTEARRIADENDAFV
ncbi:MAG: DUF2975 domain-containing protein [Rhodobacteraceae bacterium]|nr:DUF2975 domain-containing protein [Paracoccaceae bacterium]